MHLAPAGKEAMPAGDFRDWPAIDAWAAEIAADLIAREDRHTVTRQ
jgi:menaquinone-dependent protoporphyrinogen oxidase